MFPSEIAFKCVATASAWVSVSRLTCRRDHACHYKLISCTVPCVFGTSCSATTLSKIPVPVQQHSSNPASEHPAYLCSGMTSTSRSSTVSIVFKARRFVISGTGAIDAELHPTLPRRNQHLLGVCYGPSCHTDGNIAQSRGNA